MFKNKKAITIDFVEGSRVLPFIWVRFEGMKAPKLALLDTGSEITILDKTIAESVKNTAKIVLRTAEDNVIVEGVTGPKEHTDASYFASFVEVTDSKGNTHSIAMDGTVVDMSPMIEPLRKACGVDDSIMIIGSDTFKKLKAKLSYKKQQLRLYDTLCDKE